MTAQPCRHRDREPGPADSSWRASGPPPEDEIAVGTASRTGRENGGRLVYSLDEVVCLVRLSHNLHYDEMRLGKLAYVNVGRRRLITRQHLQHFLEIAS